VAPAELHLKDGPPPFVDTRPATEPLRELRVRGLTARHGDGTLALDDVSFTLQRGSFTVVTGRVGSGKSTLVRVLMGLLPREAGEVWWNDTLVTDPASHFVPPRSAYTSQVPRLFSDTLRENVAMGRTDDSGLRRAIELAVMEHDVAVLHRGLDTEVGSRGVRLSGGQVQRSAAARMFMREAELLVFDDLSSALDVETERALWEGVFALRDQGHAATCLVVSHRRAALERADQVLVMEGGAIVARGSLEHVLRTSDALGELWGEARGEALESRPGGPTSAC
jgi:ATP-binding cassette, subfamily B, bacterial